MTARRRTAPPPATADSLLDALDAVAAEREDERRLLQSDLLADRWDLDVIDELLARARDAERDVARQMVIGALVALVRPTVAAMWRNLTEDGNRERRALLQRLDVAERRMAELLRERR